jgi:predicted heme/steroid binding protein/uncharacterized membrane protein
MADMKKFTPEELATCNGENGRPIYIAHQGRVLDVTASKMWRGGQHMKRHTAGVDLTNEIAAAPHGLDVLERFPQVGVLVLAPEESGARNAPHLPRFMERFLDRHPFFQRHPHPMTVHFPIVFMLFAPLFTLLFLLTGVDGFEVTALNCLGAGLLFCLVVIPTGFFTWWVNYQGRRMTPVTIKIILSFALFLDGLAAFIWRLMDPTIFHHLMGVNVVYPILVFLLLPMIALIGWYGALLTFPLHSRSRSPKKPPVL